MHRERRLWYNIAMEWKVMLSCCKVAHSNSANIYLNLVHVYRISQSTHTNLASEVMPVLLSWAILLASKCWLESSLRARAARFFRLVLDDWAPTFLTARSDASLRLMSWYASLSCFTTGSSVSKNESCNAEWRRIDRLVINQETNKTTSNF